MTVQEETSFVFVGEALALDLINTLVVIRGKQLDLLEKPDDLAHWWEAIGERYPEIEKVRSEPLIIDTALLRSTKALRDSLRRLFTRVIQGIQGQHPDDAEIEALNEILRMGNPALEWQEGELPEAVYETRGGAGNALLFPAALSALRLLTEGDLSRLHQCHNRRCILLFYDTSKSGTREWCSTACFDRERSLQRYAQRKGLG